jgi:hypothetical protein
MPSTPEEILVDITSGIYEPQPEAKKAEIEDDGGVGRLFREIKEEEGNAIVAEESHSADLGGVQAGEGVSEIAKVEPEEGAGPGEMEQRGKRGLSGMMAKLRM